jgi:hypothetical protein
MSSRKQLKNVNPVSKKSGESHIDPLLPLVNGRFEAIKLPMIQTKSGGHFGK